MFKKEIFNELLVDKMSHIHNKYNKKYLAAYKFIKALKVFLLMLSYRGNSSMHSKTS